MFWPEVHVRVTAASLRSIPRLPLAASARLAVSCGPRDEGGFGGGSLPAPAPGQVWGGRLDVRVKVSTRWRSVERGTGAGVVQEHAAGLEVSGSCLEFVVLCLLCCFILVKHFVISGFDKCCINKAYLLLSLEMLQRFLFLELSVTCSLDADWWILKASSCYFCILISSFPLCVFLFHFRGLFSLPDALQCWEFKALMMGKLSENADPPKQLDSVRGKALCVCAPLSALFEKQHQRPYTTFRCPRRGEKLVMGGVDEWLISFVCSPSKGDSFIAVCYCALRSVKVQPG